MGDSEVKEWDGAESAQVKLRVDYRDGGNEVRPLRIPLPCLLSFLCLLPHTTLNTHTFSSCCATTCAHNAHTTAHTFFKPLTVDCSLQLTCDLSWVSGVLLPCRPQEAAEDKRVRLCPGQTLAAGARCGSDASTPAR